MNVASTLFVVTEDPLICSQVTSLAGQKSLDVRFVSHLEALLAALPNAPGGCVLVDLSFAGSLESLENVAASGHLSLPVIGLVKTSDVASAVRAMKSGAIDAVESPISTNDLNRKIDWALQLDSAARAAEALRREISSRFERLTVGERAVMEGVVAGKANKVLASRLGYSLRTIELWRRNVMTKLRVDSVAELVRLKLQADDAASATLLQPHWHFQHGLAEGMNRPHLLPAGRAASNLAC